MADDAKACSLVIGLRMTAVWKCTTKTNSLFFLFVTMSICFPFHRRTLCNGRLLTGRYVEIFFLHWTMWQYVSGNENLCSRRFLTSGPLTLPKHNLHSCHFDDSFQMRCPISSASSWMRTRPSFRSTPSRRCRCETSDLGPRRVQRNVSYATNNKLIKQTNGEQEVCQ